MLFRSAVGNMANAIKRISVQRGYDVTGYTLCTFGGAGGQHACAVADALGMRRVFIHPLAGVLSAYGMGLADVTAMREQAVELRAELRARSPQGGCARCDLRQRVDQPVHFERAALRVGGTRERLVEARSRRVHVAREVTREPEHLERRRCVRQELRGELQAALGRSRVVGVHVIHAAREKVVAHGRLERLPRLGLAGGRVGALGSIGIARVREEYAVQRVRERVVRPPRRDSAQEGRRARGVAKRIHDRGGRVGREIGQGDERGRVRGRAGE